MTGVEPLPVPAEGGNATDVDDSSSLVARSGHPPSTQHHHHHPHPSTPSAAATDAAASVDAETRSPLRLPPELPPVVTQQSQQHQQQQEQPYQVVLRTKSSPSGCSSAYSRSSGVSGRSVVCQQSLLAEQCRLVRQRRRFDKLINWCVREGVSDVASWQRSIESMLLRRPQRSSTQQRASVISLGDVESIYQSVSDLTSAADERLSSILDSSADDFMSDGDLSDADSEDDNERIPERFRLDSDSSSTVAGELFWNQRRRQSCATVAAPSMPNRWSSSWEIPAAAPAAAPPLLTSGNPATVRSASAVETTTPSRRLGSLTNAERRALMMNRQHAVSTDNHVVRAASTPLAHFVDGGPMESPSPRSAAVFQRARTFPSRSISAGLPPLLPADEAEDDFRRMNNGSVEVSTSSEDIASRSGSDGALSSVSDQSLVGLDEDDVVALRGRLLMVLELLKADIPMQFWPQLRPPSCSSLMTPGAALQPTRVSRNDSTDVGHMLG